MRYGRREFLGTAAAVVAASRVAQAQSTGAKPAFNAAEIPELQRNFPSMVDADGRLQFEFDDEQMVLNGGLQPSMLCTASGDLIGQAQFPEKPVPTQRMHYASLLGTVVSRDRGKTLVPNPA